MSAEIPAEVQSQAPTKSKDDEDAPIEGEGTGQFIDQPSDEVE